MDLFSHTLGRYERYLHGNSCSHKNPSYPLLQMHRCSVLLHIPCSKLQSVSCSHSIHVMDMSIGVGVPVHAVHPSVGTSSNETAVVGGDFKSHPYGESHTSLDLVGMT